MRFPSLSQAASQAGRAAARFPLTLLLSASAMVAGWLLVGRTDPPDGILHWMGASAIGISLSIAGALWAERRRLGGPARRAVDALVVLLVVLVWWAWRGWTEEIAIRRVLQYALAGHLLVSFLPYVKAREPNGFWQYNRRLLLRFLLATLYSGVLFAGLAIALAAVDQLLGIDVPDDTFMRLFITVAFAFHPWFFLGGIPARLSDLEEDRNYPGALKVFSQFILLPIVAVYLAILTMYLGKVLVTQDWPSGWIGYLVSSVSVVGIFSLLLVHPIEERPDNRWIRTYARSFYLFLAPSIVMLFLAIWKRIDQYGITENRYFLLVCAVWLAGMAVIFGGVRSRRISIIPVSLCALALLTSFGPWGAYAVSRTSQTTRLSSLFDAAGMLEGESMRPPARDLSMDERREMSSVLEYLLKTHGPESVTSWFATIPPPADTTQGVRDYPAEQARRLLALVNVTYVTPWADPTGAELFFNAGPGPRVVPVVGYDYAVHTTQPLPVEVTVEGQLLGFRVGADSLSVEVVRDGAAVVHLPLDSVRDALLEGRGGLPGTLPPIEIQGDGPGIRVLAQVQSVAGRETQGRLALYHVMADFLLSLDP